jgi:hypothetical protein
MSGLLYLPDEVLLTIVVKLVLVDLTSTGCLLCADTCLCQSLSTISCNISPVPHFTACITLSSLKCLSQSVSGGGGLEKSSVFIGAFNDIHLARDYCYLDILDLQSRATAGSVFLT